MLVVISTLKRRLLTKSSDLQPTKIHEMAMIETRNPLRFLRVSLAAYLLALGVQKHKQIDMSIYKRYIFYIMKVVP